MTTSADPQTALDERPIDNGELEVVLEERQKLREEAGEARKAYAEADETAKTMIAEFALEDGEVARCGQFRIEKKAVAGRSVQYDTGPTSRLTISTVGDSG